jgi:hypothetical protein
MGEPASLRDPTLTPPTRVERVDLATGLRTLLHELKPHHDISLAVDLG